MPALGEGYLSANWGGVEESSQVKDTHITLNPAFLDAQAARILKVPC